MTNKEYADFLLPNVEHTWEEYEAMYPERKLDDKAIVSRYAPSPTGLPHMGNLFQSFMSMTFCKQTNGVFFLRIEDTDTERSIDDGINKILEAVKPFNIKFDEGVTSQDTETGNYGPYIQSKRQDIYKAFAKKLIEEGKAYPSFATKEELEQIHEKQEKFKQRFGYYGRYATDRTLSQEEVIKRIENGEKYIIRLKSPGNYDNKITVIDAIKGKIEMPENDIDEVLIKSDGLPTYHFAHAVDDHLMHTTHVIRGDEWISSLPKHIQLFEAIGAKPPQYAHLAPLNKNDNGQIRKLSKRKDPEASLMYYIEEGIPTEAVMLYLATITNSNFEGWLDQNPNGKIEDFKFDFKRANASNGSLFDLPKLLNISKNYISRLTKDEVYNKALEYAKKYDEELYNLLTKYEDYSKAIFNIEREQKKPRKDYSKFSDIKEQIWYMYDELFNTRELNYEFGQTDKEEIKTILTTYINEYYDESDDKETWFNKMKELSTKLGYAAEVKEYKANPDNYKGHVGDISMVLRVGLTTKTMTPDLYEIMRILGKEKIKERYEKITK